MLSSVVLLLGLLNPPRFDLLIRNGTVIDGSNKPGFRADVAIRGDKVVKIGQIGAFEAKRVIDAKGLIVAPGFIDTLGQSEWTVVTDPRVQSKISQGITTEITGEASSVALQSPYTLKEAKFWLDAYGFDLRWTDYDGYFKAVRRKGMAINMAHLVGLGQVRQIVMRDVSRPATTKEIAKMQRLVRKGMDQGCFGVSSGLIYPPNAYMSTRELIEVTKPVKRYGGIYMSHIRDEGDRIEEAIDEALQIGREAGVPVEIHHLKVAGKNNWGRMPSILAKLEKARAAGQDVTANSYPYTAAYNGMLANLPNWVKNADSKTVIKRLQMPQIRSRIKADLRSGSVLTSPYVWVGSGDRLLVLATKNPTLARYRGKYLSEVAKMMGKDDELDALMDLLVADELYTMQAIVSMDEADVKAALRQPWIGVCCDSEGVAVDGPTRKIGLPHPRSFGSFPRILGKYVRDEKLLPIETAIYKMTGRSANRFRLDRRGFLRPGYFADVTVFDPATVNDRATFENPLQLSSGIRYVFVNGKLAVDHGRQTKTLAGQILKKHRG